MPDITVIENEYASLIYHSDEKIVHHIFHQTISGEHLRHVLNRGVELLKEHGAQKWLSDDRSNSAVSEEDSQWSMNVWVDSAVKAGWKYWALVVPQDVYGRMDMKEIVESFHAHDVRIMVFTDPDPAMKWLAAL